MSGRWVLSKDAIPLAEHSTRMACAVEAAFHGLATRDRYRMSLNDGVRIELQTVDAIDRSLSEEKADG